MATLSSAGQRLISQINGIIDDVFGDLVSPAVMALESGAYFDLLLAAQTQVNALDIVNFLFSPMGWRRERPSASENCLKIGMPTCGQSAQALGGAANMLTSIASHSSTPDMAYDRNVWTPIRNVTAQNCIFFAPKSQKIADGDIETVQSCPDSTVVKFFCPDTRSGCAMRRFVSCRVWISPTSVG